MFTVHLIVLPRVHHYWSLLRIPISSDDFKQRHVAFKPSSTSCNVALQKLEAFRDLGTRAMIPSSRLVWKWIPRDSHKNSRNFTGKTRWLTIKLGGTVAYFQTYPMAHLFKNMLESWDDEGTVPVPNNPQPLALSTTFFWKFKKSSLKWEDVWKFHILSTTPRWL